jgi:hypothetical protein
MLLSSLKNNGSDSLTLAASISVSGILANDPTPGVV